MVKTDQMLLLGKDATSNDGDSDSHIAEIEDGISR